MRRISPSDMLKATQNAACRRLVVAAALGVAMALSACESPLGNYSSDQVRLEVIAAARQTLSEPEQAFPDPSLPRFRAPQMPLPVLNLDQVDPGIDIHGKPPMGLPLGLSEAVQQAVAANLDINVARLVPVIRQQQVIEAKSLYDPTAYGEFTFRSIDQPTPGSSVGGIATGSTAQNRLTQEAEVGLTRRLETGGEITLSTGINRIDDSSPNTSYSPNPATTSNINLVLQHPLLRNAGLQVNRARITLAENARDRDVLALQRQILTTVADVETAYWQLLLAWRTVGVRQRILDLTLQTQRELEGRSRVDVSPLQLAQVASFVEARTSDLIDARRTLRDAGDQLKLLINSDRLPLAGEVLPQPADLPVEQPSELSLSDAITLGLSRRPEMGEAWLTIQDAATRVDVAKNQRLPTLNLQAQAQIYALDGTVDGSYGGLDDSEYADYLVGLRLEMPLGNRLAEAGYQRERLTRQAQTLNYRQTARQVVMTVKQTMRAMRSASQRIAAARAARIATQRNLRTLQEREKTGEALTPEFLLDLKLSTQQRLAEAELRESAAIIELNITRARFAASIGTLLEERGVDVELPSTYGRR